MVALAAYAAAALIGILASFIAYKVLETAIETSVWVDLTLDIPARTTFKMFEQLTVHFTAKFSDPALAGTMFCKIEGLQGAIITKPIRKSEMPHIEVGRIIPSLIEAAERGEFSDTASGTQFLALPPGHYTLTYGVNNVYLLKLGAAKVGPIDYTEQITLTIVKPEIKVDYTVTPEEPKVGQTVTLEGTMTIEEQPPSAFESWMRDSKVLVSIDGITKYGTLDLETGKFKITWTPDKPGEYLIVLSVVPAETYAFIGAWINLTIRQTVSGEITVTPARIDITNISNVEPIEGEDIIVTFKAEPFTEVLLELDGTNLQYIKVGSEGLVTFTLPGSKIKAGPHTIRLSDTENPGVMAEAHINAKEKPKLEINTTLSSVYLSHGGVYYFEVDSLLDGQLVPHSLDWHLADIQEGSLKAPSGLSAVKMIFPEGKYKTRIILPIVIFVHSQGETKRFEGKVTLG